MIQDKKRVRGHLKPITQANNLTYIFSALMILLLSTALLDELKINWLIIVVDIIIIFVLLLSINSLTIGRSWKKEIYGLTLLMVFLLISKDVFIAREYVDYIQLAILLLFFTGSYIALISQILHSSEVDANMIIGSIALFLLLGLIWTVIYLFLLMVFPDAFIGLTAVPWQENFSQVSYFSFVTLTTLGYGDISPKNSIAEFFVYIEAIVGMFYMAIVVSTLVSARLETLHFNKKT